MAKPRRKNNARIVFGSLAGLTGAILVAAFVAPFYGALDRPVTVVESGDGESKPDSASGNGIVVEQFDYDEPDKDADNPPAPDAAAPEAAPNTNEQNSASQSGQSETEQSGLEREPARPPLSDLGLASTPKPPEPPAPATPVDDGEPMQLLQRPVAIAAGRLESQGRIVDLQGIEVMPIEQSCQSPSGENWPCGMQARTAFRQWLRARAIMCRLPQDDSGAAIATSCSVGNDDAAQWLVANGWAKAVAGGAYQDAGEKAEAGKLGIYGSKPESALPEFGNGVDQPIIQVPQAPLQPTRPQQLDGEFPPAPQN
ncbi:thermonuclease family protein [Brucella pseudogrignonensis]|uniref:Endonuclease YncB(Thermonuclease family) n=1 Tax=Brucella pseudogrignonensis TaxID=419475 RepID=A0ABU1M7N5_9HYPH|nr:thermonuclease family protein [Brucella pseudogrignonensis]MDR6432060.1 endonuclease YncB(thermonuclease family) [Brucella pseudogrignonensis]